MSPAPSNPQKSILIVEDESPLAEALKLKLAQEGYDITVAEDGEQALRFVKDKEFDLILLDIIMPKKDGFAFLEEAQKNPPTIMILSNLGQDEEIKRAEKLGATEYLVKANSPMAKIIEKVNAILA